MIQIPAAMRHERPKHLLRDGRVRQREIQILRRTQSEIQVLLMQPNPETGGESALQHPLGMDFQHAGRREPAHQRFPHLRGIGAGFGREDQRLADGLDVQGDDDLIGDLAGLASADIAAMLDRFDLKRQLSSNRTQGVPNMIALVREHAGRIAAG